MGKIQDFVMSKKGKTLLIISGVLTVLICGVMNVYLLPSIEASTQGIRCFDMNFGYDYDTAARFLSLLTPEARSLYLHVQLPLDFVYPLAYGAFFIGLLTRLAGKLFPLCVLPAVLMVCDYTENICSIMMLTASELSPSLAGFASAVTSVKTILMYAVFAVIIVCIIVKFVKRKKQ